MSMPKNDESSISFSVNITNMIGMINRPILSAIWSEIKPMITKAICFFQNKIARHEVQFSLYTCSF